VLPLGADETLENPDKLRGVSPFLDFDVDADADVGVGVGVESSEIFAPTTFPIESLESVEGADDKSEKTGGVSVKPVSVSSRSNGDGGDIDENCFDSSLGDKDNLLIIF
jgi:hypothetical protein